MVSRASTPFRVRLIKATSDPAFSKAINAIYAAFPGDRRHYVEPRRVIKEWFDYYFEKPKERVCAELLWVAEAKGGGIIGVEWCSFYPNMRKAFLNYAVTRPDTTWCRPLLVAELERHLRRACDFVLTEALSIEECGRWGEHGFLVFLDDSVYASVVFDGRPMPAFLLVKQIGGGAIDRAGTLSLAKYVTKAYADCWADQNRPDLEEQTRGVDRRMEGVLTSSRYNPGLLSLEEYVTQRLERGTMATLASRKVFIVHGRDRSVLNECVRLLVSWRLEPVVLQDISRPGRTLIDEFEEHSSEAVVAVVLLSPDDVGGLAAAADVQARARQNVVFELGYFMGKLGRERVACVRHVSVEIPSDLGGVLYVPYQDNFRRDVFEQLHRFLQLHFDLG